MEKTINKVFNFIILLFCCYTICLGQNNNTILLKFSLARKEFKKMEIDICFPRECFQNRDYRRIVRYDTSFNKSDTLYIILPDNREHVKQEKVDVVNTIGIHPLEKVFYQSIPILSEKRMVVLKCNWYTFIFEKKKENKYKLKQVNKESFYDYINSL